LKRAATCWVVSVFSVVMTVCFNVLNYVITKLPTIFSFIWCELDFMRGLIRQGREAYCR
jgi:hypothetical protein